MDAVLDVQPPQAAPAEPLPATVEPIRFTGSGGEYFRIWIVNLLLAVVTLGIYSAWAKVRTQRYFYGHTLLAGTPFGYHGQPLAILKGRLIGVAILGAYVLTVRLAPAFILLFVLGYVLLLPWVMLTSQRFRARVTSWRGLRFDFDSTIEESIKVWALLLLAVPVTLGLVIPYWMRRRYDWALGSLRFGRTQFGFDAPTGEYYKAYGKALLVGVPLMLLAAAVAGFTLAMALKGVAVDQLSPDEQRGLFFAVGMAAYLVILPVVGVVYVLLNKWVSNLSFSAVTVGPHRLQCRLRARRLYAIYATNILLMVLTVGLFTPWAKVRVVRYRLECLSVTVAGTLDGFVADSTAPGSATGEEIADVFDFDIGF